MQHDAQEFLRCIQCYLQDAEKEVQKFSCQLPKKLSPKIQVSSILTELLNLSKVREIRDDVVLKLDLPNTGNDSQNVATKSDAERAKVNLLTKLDIKEEKDSCNPMVADTASVVDEIRAQATLPSASLKACPSPTKKISSSHCQETNTSSTSCSIRSTESLSVSNDTTETLKEDNKNQAKGISGRGNKSSRATSADRKKKSRNKEIDEPETDKTATPSVSTSSNRSRKRLGMRGNTVPKIANGKSETSCSEGDNDNTNVTSKESMSVGSIKSRQSQESKLPSNKSSLTDGSVNSDSISNQDIKGSDGNERNTFQSMFQAYLQQLATNSTDDSVNSDSEDEDIVLQKKRAKLLHESPRRSPRKNQSEGLHGNLDNLKSSYLSLSKSDSLLRSVTTKLKFESVPTDCDRSIAGSNKNQNSETVQDAVPQCNENGIKRSSESDLNGIDHSANSDNLVEKDVTASESGSTISLVPVVILENCDHLLSENGKSVSARYASQVLTPVKRESWEESNNYLKRRSLTFGEIQNEEELRKALEEMLNTPVKSRSKFDMVERQFQVLTLYNLYF